MIDQPAMKLFSITLTAWRIENDQPQVAMRNMIALSAGEVDLEQQGKKAAHDLFPVANGWQDHSAVWTEITQGMPVGPFRLTWHADPPTATENERSE